MQGNKEDNECKEIRKKLNEMEENKAKKKCKEKRNQKFMKIKKIR